MNSSFAVRTDPIDQGEHGLANVFSRLLKVHQDLEDYAASQPRWLTATDARHLQFSARNKA
jgi:hypothetical protein